MDRYLRAYVHIIGRDFGFRCNNCGIKSEAKKTTGNQAGSAVGLLWGDSNTQTSAIAPILQEQSHAFSHNVL